MQTKADAEKLGIESAKFFSVKEFLDNDKEYRYIVYTIYLHMIGNRFKSVFRIKGVLLFLFLPQCRNLLETT